MKTSASISTLVPKSVAGTLLGLTALANVVSAQTQDEQQGHIGVDTTGSFPVYACTTDQHVVGLNVETLVRVRTANNAQADKVRPILEAFSKMVHSDFAKEISDMGHVDVEVAFSNLVNGRDISAIETLKNFGQDFKKATRRLDVALGLISVPNSDRDVQARFQKQVFLSPKPDYRFCGPKQESI